MPDETIAQSLARFVTGLRYEDLPAPVIEQTKKLVLDQLACELIGSTMPWVQPALRFVQFTRGVAAESTVVGDGFRCLAADAAFVNASFGQACELDDSAFGAAGHIGTATVPVAFAMGERAGLDGRQIITAIVAGYEVMYRLMRAIRPYHNARGFHGQGIGGPFAAAAVAGKLLNLTAEQMLHAFGIAGSHAGCSLEYDQSGGEVKRIHAGIAARGGIHSAFLARLGLTGPATIIEGQRGFCNIFATQSNPSGILPGLGQDFNIANVVFKMYPSIGGHHTAIRAAEHLVETHGMKPGDIARIRVGVAERSLLHGAGINRPRDVIGAQFSLAFSLALAFARKGNVLENYMNPALWTDPELTGLMDAVEVYAHADADGDRSHMSAVSVTLKDGRAFEGTEYYIIGSPRNPASNEDLMRKARSLSGKVLSGDAISALIRSVLDLEAIEDVSTISRLLVGERH